MFDGMTGAGTGGVLEFGSWNRLARYLPSATDMFNLSGLQEFPSCYRVSEIFVLATSSLTSVLWFCLGVLVQA